MKVCLLSSGSKGNSCLVETKETKILIDLGTTCQYVCNELDKIDVNPREIDAILITHTHKDHIGGLKVFTKKYNTWHVTNALHTKQRQIKSAAVFRRRQFWKNFKKYVTAKISVGYTSLFGFYKAVSMASRMFRTRYTVRPLGTSSFSEPPLGMIHFVKPSRLTSPKR